MSPEQMAQQIQSKLQAVAWLGGSANVVFGTQHDAVQVISGAPDPDRLPPGFPWALVSPGTGPMDEEHPDSLTQEFDIIIGVESAGDAMGQHAVIGSSIADVGKSAGRGIFEVARRARSAVQALTGADGAKVIASATSSSAPGVVGRGHHVVVGGFTVTAVCTSDHVYAAPQNLVDTAFTWTWEGAHCSDRFDFVQYRMYEHTSIMTGPGTAASGTPTLLYTGTAATFDYGTVSGRYYHVFADYNQRDQTFPATASIEGTSSVEVGSYRLAP